MIWFLFLILITMLTDCAMAKEKWYMPVNIEIVIQDGIVKYLVKEKPGWMDYPPMVINPEN